MEATRSDYRASDLTAAIADRVKELRRARRMSHQQLASQMAARGVTSWNRSTGSKLETGRREAVTADELVALATALEVPVTTLLGDEPQRETAKQRLRRVRLELGAIERMIAEVD